MLGILNTHYQDHLVKYVFVLHHNIEPTFFLFFDYYYFRENFRIIAKKPNTIKIKNDLLNKIVKDLIEIYNLIENEEEIENNYQLAFDKVQNIIDRNKNFFERLS